MQTKGSEPRGLFSAAALSPALDAYVQINQLKLLFRQGWLRRGMPRDRCETVAEHTAGVAWLTLLLAPETPGLNVDRALQMALIHDLGETHAGDITPRDGVSDTDKHARERQALIEVIAGLPTSCDWLSLWQEYETGETPEARFVREVDRLEMGLQATIYGVEGLVDPIEFIASSRAAVSAPALRGILEELISRGNAGG